MRILYPFVLAVAVLAGPAAAQDLTAGAAAIRDKALADPTDWDIAESLTTEVGPRMVGSPAMQAFRASLAPLKVVVLGAPPRSGGADIAGLIGLKVPFADFNQDAGRYFDLHHSADVTLDKIDPTDLAQNVAVWASFLYTTANSDVDFRPKAAPATQ